MKIKPRFMLIRPTRPIFGIRLLGIELIELYILSDYSIVFLDLLGFCFEFSKKLYVFADFPQTWGDVLVNLIRISVLGFILFGIDIYPGQIHIHILNFKVEIPEGIERYCYCPFCQKAEHPDVIERDCG